mmetsp:Transcript_14969/g.28169  ORF Transcript_14969/g.28169 Transcript_14969/m.28169 type:complete len:138 (+) Transcript_14969:367-780(+)
MPISCSLSTPVSPATILNCANPFKQNETWTPSIELKSTHFSHTTSKNEYVDEIHAVHNNTSVQHTVNLSLFLDESKINSPALNIFRSQLLQYPPNAVLELEGFIGLDKERDVINALKDAAAASGTILVVESVKKSRR